MAGHDWRSRETTAAAAVAGIRSGASVFVGTACATPRTLVQALEASEERLADVQLVHFLTDGVVPELAGGPYSRFRHRVFFVGTDVRPLVAEGRAEYVPISAAQVHRLIENGRLPIDVAFVQVAPPDAEGRCSLGVSVDLTLAAGRHARRVVAEVNPRMPRTRGDTTIPAESIDRWVAVDAPVIEYVHPPVDEVAERVARYVARIIDDGATLHVGLGRVPNEMLRHLTNRRDLGIHSDVITDPLVDLVEQGVVTGSRKSVHRGEVVASYCMGTRRLYDLVDDNPAFRFHPLDYVCRPDVLAAQHQLVSVTQAFAVDLTGQVCADQFAGELYGGVSTQPDFLRGAAASPGGKPIVCLSSRTDDGGSRIRPLLEKGEGVTVARSDVHYVVTEYGIAYLFGRSIRERALALIEIAHPSAREELLAAAKELGYLGPKQTLKSRRDYPVEEERRVVLRGGEEVLVRPSKATDVRGMQDLFYSLREEDVYTRFFTKLGSFSDARAQHLCSVSYEEEMAFVAVLGDLEQERIVGGCCYYVDPTTNLADVAYMIHPEWQGRGLGTVLQGRLVEYARERGLRGFTADVLTANQGMIKVFEKSGCRIERRVVSGVYELRLLFDEEGAR